MSSAQINQKGRIIKLNICTPKFYTGNYPNSANYDDNVPVGYNRWDGGECYDDDEADETDEDIPDETE